MANDPVIYEVNLAIARNRGDEFDLWLQHHVEAMLALPGFTGAQTLTVEPDPDAGADAPLQRTVQYQLTDRPALDRYFEQHAARMRADGQKRFGADMSASRRILAQPGSATHHSDTQHCANCGAPLDGQYCSACGQRHRTRMISVWELVRSAFEDIIEWDSRVWRTLRPLLFSPGKLTAEYLAGRRVHYTPPVRMYLVLSISFFVLSQLPALEDFQAVNILGINDNEAPVNVTISDDANEAIETVDPSQLERDTPTPEANSDDPTPGNADAPDADGDNPCDIDSIDVNVPGIDPDAAARRLERMCERIRSEEGQSAFTNSFADIAPNLLIILLPFIALAGKLFYPLSRRYYVEHLLFYTHFHSFLFLLLILLMLLSAVVPYLPVPSYIEVISGIAAGIYVVYYAYRALRRVFNQGRLATAFKMFLIWMAYVFLSSILLAIGAALAALQL